MGTLRYLTAGESHGPTLVAILEGLPAGIPIDAEAIDTELARRQQGYGRSERMRLEHDHAEILSGVRRGQTLGTPIALRIDNRIANMDALPALVRPRPGHADLAGGLKYDHRDLRNTLERASARETAARVALGALARQFLAQFNVELLGHVIRIGEVTCHCTGEQGARKHALLSWRKATDRSPVRCADAGAARKMVAAIDAATRARDTLGGVFEVIARGLPPGLGSHVQADRRLDGRLAQAIMSIQAVKAVEIGTAVANASRRGSAVHDEIYYRPRLGFYHTTNRAGGLEGGVTNGEPLIVRGYLKPISTLRKALRSVDIRTKRVAKAAFERSDICVVPAAAVVGEAAAAFVLAQAWLEKFGGDSLKEVRRNYQGYLRQLKRY